MTKKTLKLLLASIIIFIILISANFYFGQPISAVRAENNNFLLTWSSNSYIPASYPGKALPSMGTTIKVTVLPIKKLAVNPDSLTYLWVIDGTPAYKSQGKGKSTLEFPVTKWNGDTYEIEARVLDNQENMLWRGFLTIEIAQPEILFNVPNNNYVITESLKAGTGKELIIRATPLFFRANRLSDLIFDWQLNGQKLTPADNEKNPDQLTIKIPSGNLSEILIKKLSLAVQNPLNSLQLISANLNLEIK